MLEARAEPPRPDIVTADVPTPASGTPGKWLYDDDLYIMGFLEIFHPTIGEYEAEQLTKYYGKGADEPWPTFRQMAEKHHIYAMQEQYELNGTT